MKNTYTAIVNPHGLESIYIHKLPSLEIALNVIARELSRLHEQARTVKSASIVRWNNSGFMEEVVRLKCQFGDLEEITL